MSSEKKEPMPEFAALYEALDALAKAKGAIRFDFKIRFLDKSSLEYQYRNPDYDKRGKKL